MKLALAFVFSLLFVIIFCVVTIQNTTISFPTITLNIPGQGTILGNYETTLWTKQMLMQFRGIPYAESPRGKLRFKPPVPRQPWRQIIDATQFGKRCPVITTVSELSEQELRQDLEDCLNLCVYTKNLTARQPVMFYIYGGGFYNGSSADFPPQYLLEKDIVLVVPHYRIGALGWLSTLTENMPGNAPIMDIMLALQWVQHYISAFGGDPEQVTVFGQSAGATAIGALLLSPATPDGLFKRVIMQSGSIMAHWAINAAPHVQSERICSALGCQGCEHENKLHECLQTVTVKKLLEVTTEESFAPIVGDLNGLLPQHPSELIKHYNKAIPVMAGFTKHDGSFVLATYYDVIKSTYGNDASALTVRQFANGLLDMANDTTRLSNNVLMHLLFTAELLNGHEHKQALPAYFEVANAQFIKSPMLALSSYLVRNRLAHTYVYSFDYEGEHTRFGYEFGNEHYPFNGGVHHSNDNIYLFPTHRLNADDMEIAKKMTQLWTSFAITGVPCAGDGGPIILPMEFESGPYFHINKEITISHDVLAELTSTVNDPDNKKLNRVDIEF